MGSGEKQAISGMVLPYLGAGLTLVLLAISLKQSQANTIITEEDLMRALMAREAAQQPGYGVDTDMRLLGKRARQMGFSSWAGKRSGREQQAFSSWAGKRAPFNSWAGKRSGEEEMFHEPEYVRRKRSSAESDLSDDSSLLVPGGGRFARDLRGTQAMVKLQQNEQVFRPARATFSAWGGKRAER